MPKSSKYGAIAVGAAALGMTNVADAAMGHAHDAERREREANQDKQQAMQWQAQIQNMQANIAAGQKAAALMGTDALPEGFVPPDEIRSLSALGRFPSLSDGFPVTHPYKDMVEMGVRLNMQSKKGAKKDKDAEAWGRIYYAAMSGDPAAMRQFGKIYETGAFGVSQSVERAFFFYFRASLLGDKQAGADAERILKTAKIPKLLMEDPALVFPGVWRLTSNAFEQVSSMSVFNLRANGNVEGRGVQLGGAAGEMLDNVLGMWGDEMIRAMAAAVMKGITYSGRWQFDKARKALKMDLTMLIPGAPGPQRSPWEIPIEGIREGMPIALFGRDRKLVSHIIEQVVPEPGK